MKAATRIIQTSATAILLIAIAFGLSSCGKKCRDLKGNISGEISSLYDFKECYPYATFDSILVIASDTAFDSYKKSHLANCSATLDPIDFSKNMLLGFKTITHACNAGFHRNITLDSANKIYRFTVDIETCSGCGTELLSTNFVLGPPLPAGYKIEFIRKERR